MDKKEQNAPEKAEENDGASDDEILKALLTDTDLLFLSGPLKLHIAPESQLSTCPIDKSASY